MKSRMTVTAVLGLFLMWCVPALCALQDRVTYRAVSLKVLQKRLKSYPRGASYPAELTRFAGLTKLAGYIIDEIEHDLVFFGEMEEGSPALYVDDLVVALRNTWLKYAEVKGARREYRAPYCSIEPDLKVVEELKKIGVQILKGSDSDAVERAIEKWRSFCRMPQSVRISGIPFTCHFAEVMVEADYSMKKLALGCDSADVAGFESFGRMTLEKARRDLEESGAVSAASSIGNRFWFYPGEILFLEHEGIVMIDQCPVTLLTEESYLGKTGKITGRGESGEAGDAFARQFTEMYADLAVEKPVYIEFENLFHVLALSKGMQYKSSPEQARLDLGYLLDQHPVSKTPVREQVPGESHVEAFEHRLNAGGSGKIAKVWLPFCGGVAMNIEVSGGNFRRDTSGRLSDLKKQILRARPNSSALSWDVTF